MSMWVRCFTNGHIEMAALADSPATYKPVTPASPRPYTRFGAPLNLLFWLLATLLIPVFWSF